MDQSDQNGLNHDWPQTAAGKYTQKVFDQGIIMCDGYDGYSNRLYPNAKFGSCLVHIQREFINIIKALHNRPAKSSIAQQAISLLRSLFHTEKYLYIILKKKKPQSEGKESGYY